MQNSTKTPKNRIQSKFLHQRRQSFLTTRTEKLGFEFLKKNRGSLTSGRMPSGAYRAIFNSKETGRKAFAYGITFNSAYQNMILLFNLKYSV